MTRNKDLKFYLILVIALFLMFGLRFIPIASLTPSMVQLLGIFMGVLLLWLFVAIDWPSILLLGALALVPELSFNNVIASSYGNSTFVFLMFTFIVTYALSRTSYLKRIALSFITSKIAQKGPWHFVILYSASIIFLGMFISPTVLFFVYLPIVEEICAILKVNKGDKLGALLMMSTVIMCGISSGMTPIAHVFPLISMGLYADMYAESIDYARYMIIAVPVGILCAALVLVSFKVFLRPDMNALNLFNAEKLKREKGTVTFEEKLIMAVFILVVCLWVLPGLLMLVIKEGLIYAFLDWFDSLGTAMPPLIGTVLLCIIHVKQRPLLNIAEAMSKGVSWPSLIMCAGTLALGSALTNSDIGFTLWLSENLAPIIDSVAPFIMVMIFALWAAVQTNLSSNMVTATLVTTAALSITYGLDNISIPAIVIIIGMLASYSFATPPAMPCVAIAISSGYTSTMQMMTYGFLAMFIGVFFAVCVGYPLALCLF